MLTTRTLIPSLLAASLLTACGGEPADTVGPAPSTEAPSVETPQTEVAPDAAVSLADILAGDQRDEKNKARDQFRNPAETLEFFGLEPDMTVVEISPGGGWYTEILAPYLNAGGGTYIAAHFDPNANSDYAQRSLGNFRERFVDQPEVYGEIVMSVMSKDTEGVAPAGTADMVLTFRNVHNWMRGGYADTAFEHFYTALKPGGILGVVEHRAKNDAPQDPEAVSGYVRQDYTIALAEAAGFELVATSEINANPKDTADHPFGVWTLPPVRRSSEGRDAPSPEGFDRAAYDAIGESDRMTLKFIKPVTADGAMLE